MKGSILFFLTSVLVQLDFLKYAHILLQKNVKLISVFEMKFMNKGNNAGTLTISLCNH